MDRAGISKGYGFVTFETEQEAQRLQNEVEQKFCLSIFLKLKIFFFFVIFRLNALYYTTES